MAIQPTYVQLERMVEFMEENPQLARSMRCNMGRYETKLKWEELANILNSMNGLKKNPNQWIQFWIDKKKGVQRRLDACRNDSACRIRCGLNGELQRLSYLDEKIVLLVGDKKTSCGKKNDSSKQPDGPKKTDCSKKRAKKTTTRQVPVDQPLHNTVAIQTTQPEGFSRAPVLRRSVRIRNRNQIMERQRLLLLQERRITNEAVLERSLRKACRSLSRVTKAVVRCGHSMATTLRNLR